MEQISQLRTMREEAITRLQINPDFKLVNSLDALIRDLEEFSRGVEPAPIIAESTADSEVKTPPDNLDASTTSDDNNEVRDEDIVEDNISTSDEEANSIAEEISILAGQSYDDAGLAIESLEAELIAATSNDSVESGAIGEENLPDANGMIN